MKALIIGGTGHIGSYLVPRLVRNGFDVHVVARHSRPQYADSHLGWSGVQWIVADREAEEKSGAWEKRMRDLDTDIVVDLLCFRLEQLLLMHKAFHGRISHFLHCGTIWAYGPSEIVPYEEFHPRRPITDYGLRKVEIERFLLEIFRSEGFPATIIHPGHISGRKWLPVDPQGAIDGVEVYRRLATGEEVVLPDQGLATLHHVHGDDVAQLFERAIQNRERALGESFSVVAPYALSLLGCCRAVAVLFGRDPRIRFIPLADFVRGMKKESAETIQGHVSHSSCCSIIKAVRLLGYAPRFTTEQIYAECIEYLLESGPLLVGV